MVALVEARELELKDWCIGAGAVRSVVWDTLHDYANHTAVEDIDLVYFDPDQTDIEIDKSLSSRLPEVFPGSAWEVVNQATVHVWYPSAFGHDVDPFKSLEEGVGSWPEYATAVGLGLNDDETIRVIAPHGLEDLFEMRVRHNPSRASVDAFQERMRTKCFKERWPQVTVYL
ncbi:hypothetical protein ATO7_10913 [Oceanococcus atlanticus]|uniref:Nucleotidyltransferase family protein n=2 Tax=Oceanococcus atlanticus TaxID=1317117 RepID=A0A1Y1SB16_9GAMM|nr:hypothetical protein ATO7_10913 [Oceanococcus atlanticus]